MHRSIRIARENRPSCQDENVNLTAKKDCEECKGTGEILTEGVVLGRPYYSKEHSGIVYDAYGDGNWQKTVCPCLSEND